MFCVVAYDMPDNKRRSRLFKTMKGYGRHTQFSVFECHLTEHHFRIMLAALQSIIVDSEDNIKVYLLCRDCVKTILIMGTASLFTRPDCMIF